MALIQYEQDTHMVVDDKNRGKLNLDDFAGDSAGLLEEIKNRLKRDQFAYYDEMLERAFVHLPGITIGTPETDENPFTHDDISHVNAVFRTMFSQGYGNNPDFNKACDNIYVNVNPNGKVVFMIKEPLLEEA